MDANWRVLRAEPRFRRLLVAGFLSGIGNWFNSVAALALMRMPALEPEMRLALSPIAFDKDGAAS